MMRVTQVEREDAVGQLRVEGRIVQHHAEELHALSTECLAKHRTLLLDVSGVRFADPLGLDVLRRLVPQGTVLVGCSGFLAEMLRADADLAGPPVTSAPAVGAGEKSLVERLRCGDDGAFEELVRQYGGRLLATARRFFRDEQDACDVLQEAFLSAFKGIGRFHGGARLSTWLHRVVINAALMKLRSRRRRPEESIDDLLPRFDEAGEWVDGPSGWDASSEVLLQRRETRAMVRRCIERLPETYRSVLLLRDIEELDTDEAAAALGITPNAAKIRLHRARQALRALLERELAGQEEALAGWA